MMKWMLGGVCILGALAPLTAAVSIADDAKAERIAGRWSEDYGAKRGNPLTLDIVPCDRGWCGIKVEADDKCGGVALKLGSVQRLDDSQSDSLLFEGTLQLVAGSEPYIVHAWLMPRPDNGALILQITGDTGGTYRAWRRSFPFEAAMGRVQDAECHAPQTVSSLRRALFSPAGSR